MLKGHYLWEEMLERKLKIGTTKRAIGTAYAGKTLRFNLRFEDLISADFEKKYDQFNKFISMLTGANSEEIKRSEFEELASKRQILIDHKMVIDANDYLRQCL